MELLVSKELDGATVKHILFSVLGMSHACVSRLKRLSDGILLNGESVTVRAAVRENDLLVLAVEDREEDRNPYIFPSDLELDILYEDCGCMAVNKPAGVPTHPTHGHRDDTLANAYAAFCARKGRPFVFRPVNRLDRETSGAVLIAKSAHAAAVLGSEMADGRIGKRYVAVLEGELPGDRGTVTGYVSRTEHSIILRELKESGRESEYSVTNWKKIAAADGYTVVEAEPLTGKTHQLRVHFSSLGAPIAGDSLYGAKTSPAGRLALHARYLTFTSAEGGAVTVEAPVPGQLKDLIETIRSKCDG